MDDTVAHKQFKITREKAEDMLKAYRCICWRLSYLEDCISDELGYIGVSHDSLNFLSKVFYQNTDLKTLVESNDSVEGLRYIKDIVDFAMRHLQKHPNNGVVLHNVIYTLYIEEANGHKISFDKAFERHKRWMEKQDETVSMPTFKNHRNIAIDRLLPMMNNKLNIIMLSLDARHIKSISDVVKSKYKEKDRLQLNKAYEHTSELQINP